MFLYLHAPPPPLPFETTCTHTLSCHTPASVCRLLTRRMAMKEAYDTAALSSSGGTEASSWLCVGGGVRVVVSVRRERVCVH